MAMALFKMGIFDPDKTEQAVACLEMMSFEGKDDLIQKVLLRRASEQECGRLMPSDNTPVFSRLGNTDSARHFATEAPMPRER